jgi:hypothetical protein
MKMLQPVLDVRPIAARIFVALRSTSGAPGGTDRDAGPKKTIKGEPE